MVKHLLRVYKIIDSFPSVEENKKGKKIMKMLVSIIVFVSFHTCSGEEILFFLLATR